MNETSRSISDIVSSVDKPASYLAAARELAASERAHLAHVRIFVLSSFTFDLVTPYLVVESARRGLAARVQIGPFGQLEQVVLSNSADIAGANVIVVATRIEDLAPALADSFLRMDDAIDGEIASYVTRLENLCRAIRERSNARILVWNQTPLRRWVAGVADVALARPQQLAIAQLNQQLAHACLRVPGVVIFDAARVCIELGTKQWFDSKLEALARTPLSGAAQLAVGSYLARMLRALQVPPCKCLVLDLDNTLWGGVLGEDGLAGIQLGDDHPGSVFKKFQRALRGYRDRGVLLAIASKNNPDDVAELFANHADMVLKREDFATVQIHWNDKASSLRAIAEELNIGVDSLAFFDDNPLERAWVREQLPEVTVIEVPKDPLRYLDALDDSGAFDHLIVTAEDRQRAGQYQREHQRRELERTAGSLEEFLQALEMKVRIGKIDESTLPRVAQLLSKTNQFNVTTRRHTESDLAGMLARDGAIGLWMRVSDRYGDHGLIAVGIAMPEAAETYRLDSFLMSCRVLGRKAEHALLHAIVRRARDHGAKTMLGEFIPSKKNAPAAEFFADTGFVAVEGRVNWWRLALETCPDASPLFEVIEES